MLVIRFHCLVLYVKGQGFTFLGNRLSIICMHEECLLTFERTISYLYILLTFDRGLPFGSTWYSSVIASPYLVIWRGRGKEPLIATMEQHETNFDQQVEQHETITRRRRTPPPEAKRKDFISEVHDLVTN